MKQHEAVLLTFEKLGGLATLGQLYQEVFKIKDCDWNTKTPDASIRRIVQKNDYIYKIKPGLYGLLKKKDEFDKRGMVVENDINKSPKTLELNHSYYQGLILELGNLKNFRTFLPHQDKNKLFLNKKLSDISSLDDIPHYSYDSFVSRSSTIDVIWFNQRNMPYSFFEVEHTTDIQNSLLKFNDLQDFYTNMYIVADKKRKNEFLHKIEYSAFKYIKGRVNFLEYEAIAKLHELEIVKQKISINL